MVFPYPITLENTKPPALIWNVRGRWTNQILLFNCLCPSHISPFGISAIFWLFTQTSLQAPQDSRLKSGLTISCWARSFPPLDKSRLRRLLFNRNLTEMCYLCLRVVPCFFSKPLTQLTVECSVQRGSDMDDENIT